MSKSIYPENYHSDLNLHDTQVAIKTVKDFFQRALTERLNLLRVTAPLFVEPSSGLNDNLNGVERPVSFDIRGIKGSNAEIVHSLAKYVDQWDWEKIITKEDRTVDTLKQVVQEFYQALKKTEKYMAIEYDYIEEILPKNIFFITSQELEDRYPDCTPKEREYKIAKLKGAVFIMQIGGKLKSGLPHDGRAPDYDDWSLNGDIIVYYPVLDIALELSSMGIRVDEDSLKKQLELAGCPERAELPFQKAILNKELPYTIGGGIGQSRICMFYLRKAHIGEVQASLWPEEETKAAAEHGIELL